MGDAKKPDVERAGAAMVYSLRLPLELADRLTRWRKVQPVEPGFTATVVRALVLFLAKMEEQTSYRLPAWEPVCPKCGGSAYWIHAHDLVATCPSCRTWGFGAYPDQEGHEIFAERWGGAKAGGGG